MTKSPIKLRMQSPMTRFVVISVCIHATLFLSSTYAFRFAGQERTVLSVTFNATDQPAAIEALNSPAEKSGQHSRSNHPNRGVQHIMTAKNDATAPAHSTPAASASSSDVETRNASAESKQQSARARIKAQLLADLQRYFEYPLMARRAGWQGVVWLSVTLEPNGKVEHINLARSSGYSVLDSSAIDAMRRVGRLAEGEQWLPHWSGGRSLEVPIPVVYRLTDG